MTVTALTLPRLHNRPDPQALVAATRALAEEALQRAAALDQGGGFPALDVLALRRAGLLTAPLPPEAGGAGAGTRPEGALLLATLLRLVGRASLPLGRLWEGHVNALRLIDRQGTMAQRTRAAADARAGRLFAVWNTERPPGLRLLAADGGWRLAGGKNWATGAGHVQRPLVTALHADGSRRLLLLNLDGQPAAVDASGWRVRGMRATQSGRIALDGLPADAIEVVGPPDVYDQQPELSAGAWRFLAVQAGGIEALLETTRAHLVTTGRQQDPHQRGRLADLALAAATARLWVEAAATLAEAEGGEPEAVMARVGLARMAVERAAMEAIALAERSIGAAGFVDPHPLARQAADLAFYLRQPNPDAARDGAAGYVLERSGHAGDHWA